MGIPSENKVYFPFASSSLASTFVAASVAGGVSATFISVSAYYWVSITYCVDFFLTFYYEGFF